jgi:hypothetical protein
VRYLRLIADAQVDAGEACRAYHADLRRLKIPRYQPLEEDVQPTRTGAAYDAMNMRG